MKKVISLILSLLCLVLCFGGCGETSVYGTYAFQMGEKGAKSTIGIYLNLNEKDYVNKSDQKVKGKSFTLTFKVPSVFGDDNILGLFQSLINADTTENANKITNEITVDGYYNIGEKIDNLTRLKINIPLDKIWDPEYGPTPVIGDEILEKLFYVTVKDGEVDFVLPISIKNLIYQFYWYGIDLGNTVEPGKAVTEHAVGTHPTQAEIDDININKNYPAEHDGEEYYGFNTLTMRLSRMI